MIRFLKKTKLRLFTVALLLAAVPAIPQVKPISSSSPKLPGRHLREFQHLTADAGVQFTFPAGFKETRVLNNEDFSFDYAMEIPGHDFEVWFLVRPQKRDWQIYEASKNDPAKRLENPDSSYIKMGQAQASTFSADDKYMPRNISPEVLKRYHATAGKSYLVDLPDLPATRHYKYALILTLQRDHVGRILAICFANEKNPEFFKNVNRMSHYIRFKF